MAAPFSDEIRQAVLADVRAGKPYREIAATHGIRSLDTISKWARLAGIEPDRAEQVRAATEGTKVAWAKRRGELVDELGAACAEFLKRALDETDSRRAEKWMIALAVGFDKAQLGSGGVTSRYEQIGLEKTRERIAAMRDELADKRASKDGTTGS